MERTIKINELKICLCGFMGSGKTTVAKEVSRMTGLPFADTDQMIVQAAGKTIPEIFATLGEERFRELEYEAILELMDEKRFIASLGGGAVLFPRNVKAIKSAGGVIVWIDVPLDVINRRLQGDSGRPLLDKDLDKRRALYLDRIPHYQAACDLRLEGGDSRELARIIIDKFFR